MERTVIEKVDRQFYGRHRLVSEITSSVLDFRPASFSLVGPKLIGKTSLLEHLASPDGPLCDVGATRDRIIVALIDCDWQDVRQDIPSAIATRIAQQVRAAEDLEIDWDLVEGEPTPSRQIWQMGRQLTESGRRAVLLIDNFDAVFRDQSLSPETVEALRPLMQVMPFIVTSEQPLYDLDKDLVAAPLYDAMTQHFLSLMEPDAAEEWTQSFASDHPALTPGCDDLIEMTGHHPFLLRRLGNIMDDVHNMLAGHQPLGPEHLPLIRMRLSEHGRPLFVTLWRRMQTPPQRVNLRIVMPLLERLLTSPLPIDATTTEQSPALNWLINQAIVVYGIDGYRFACPLFAEFLNRRIGAEAAVRTRRADTDHDGSPFLSNLTKTENALLHYFQTNSNTVISSEQLLEDVWNRPDASPRRVQEAIRRLRLRLDEAVPPVGAIQNERGRGYRFVPAEI